MSEGTSLQVYESQTLAITAKRPPCVIFDSHHPKHYLTMRALARRCLGAGVELPAFAARVVAHANTSFALPELEMGLVPGAGGTVSLPRRIGRQRTAWLALTGQRLDV